MWMLELISAGNAGPFDVFPGHREAQPAASYSATGKSDPCWMDLLIVRHPPCPGLDEGPIHWRIHDDVNRFEQYKRSKLKLTELLARRFWCRPTTSADKPDRPLVGRHAPDRRSAVALNQALMKP
jgi:hypothetical protein